MNNTNNANTSVDNDEFHKRKITSLNVLIVCEESQRVCVAFRNKGHKAFSCDIQESSGGHPEWHIKGDCIPLLNGNCKFTCEDGHEEEQIGQWDLIIAHPPCTDLAVSGAAWFAKKREDGRQRNSIEFFATIYNADCDKIAIENPVGIIGGDYMNKWFPDLVEKYHLPKPTQAIQPYEHGHHASKKTCLWLKGLPEIVPTNVVDDGEWQVAPSGRRYNYGSASDTARDERGKALRWNDPRTSKIRSKTYEGIAKAFADQWG